MADEPIKKLLPYFFGVILILLIFISNFVLQIIRKPVELIGMFASNSYKSTHETWQAYEELFQQHSTPIMTPQFLCALVQVESGGNPLITPKWRWQWTTDLTRIYAPASSSVGLLQYTDATFEDAKRFCIHDHKVATAGPLSDFDSCWFNFLYTRLSPSHSIEVTSARLHYYIQQIINEHGQIDVPLRNKHQLGAVIHLCGVSNGKRFVERNFNFKAMPKCGSHDAALYYGRIEIIMNSLPP